MPVSETYKCHFCNEDIAHSSTTRKWFHLDTQDTACRTEAIPSYLYTWFNGRLSDIK